MHRLIISLMLGFAAALGASAQVPLAQQPTAALEARYEALQAAYWQTNDRSKMDAILDEQKSLGDELMRRNIAMLKANDAAFAGINVQLTAASAQLEVVAHNKWCHKTLWRWMRRYREPQWCNR